MSDTTFGVGFVGAGFIAREMHAPSFAYIPGAAITGVLNPTKAKARSFAEECREAGTGDPAVYGEGDLEKLVRNPNVDGLWITSPNDTRLDVVQTVAQSIADGADLSGIALEKPVARTITEAKTIASLIEEIDVPTAYLENYVHDPEIGAMKERLWERGRPRPLVSTPRTDSSGSSPMSSSSWFSQSRDGLEFPPQWANPTIARTRLPKRNAVEPLPFDRGL